MLSISHTHLRYQQDLAALDVESLKRAKVDQEGTKVCSSVRFASDE